MLRVGIPATEFYLIKHTYDGVKRQHVTTLYISRRRRWNCENAIFFSVLYAPLKTVLSTTQLA